MSQPARNNEKIAEPLCKMRGHGEEVVDKIIKLIAMEQGTRPIRNPIDQISGDAFVQKVVNDISALGQQQMNAYGF